MIVGWIVVPVLVGTIAQSNASHYSDDHFTTTLNFGTPIYYILARFGVWIYDGFKEQQES